MRFFLILDQFDWIIKITIHNLYKIINFFFVLYERVGLGGSKEKRENTKSVEEREKIGCESENKSSREDLRTKDSESEVLESLRSENTEWEGIREVRDREQ